MKDRKLYLYWLYLYILCAALGFIPTPRGALVAIMLSIVFLLFFLPPGLILHRAIQRRDRKPLKQILLISGCALILSMLLFIANTLTILVPDNLLLGNIFNALWIVFSTPMGCAPYQVLGLFGWACLLFTAITNWKKTENSPQK